MHTLEPTKNASDLQKALGSVQAMPNSDDKASGTEDAAPQSQVGAGSRIWQAGNIVANGIKTSARSANALVHRNPWPSIGLIAGAAVVLGWLLGRR